MNDLIDRQAAIDAVLNLNVENRVSWRDAVIDTIDALPSAQPDWTEIMIQCDNCGHMIHAKREDCKVSAQPEMNLDEWCTDCKEYDHERHCCPRWNRVIRQTLKDMKEEQPEPSMEECACCVLSKPQQRWIPVDLRNNSPEENKVVLLGVLFRDDFKYFVTSRQDYNYWTGLGREIKGELRWQPLPEPYEERRTDE